MVRSSTFKLIAFLLSVCVSFGGCTTLRPKTPEEAAAAELRQRSREVQEVVTSAPFRVAMQNTARSAPALESAEANPQAWLLQNGLSLPQGSSIAIATSRVPQTQPIPQGTQVCVTVCVTRGHWQVCITVCFVFQ